MTTAALITADLILNSDKFSSGMKTAGGSMDTFSSKMKNIGGAMTKFGGMMTLGVTAPIVAFGASSIKSFSESEAAIAEFDTVLKASEVSMGTFSETTRVLSDDDLAKLQKDFNSANDKLTMMAQKYKEAKKPTDSMRMAVEAQAQKVNELSRALDLSNATTTKTITRTHMQRQAMLDLAAAYQKVTKFSDEEILSGESMLLTFTNIGKDVFPAATKAMLDLAQFQGIDPRAAALMLGKALNDPVEGINALSRAGLKFTDAETKAIAKMVEMGDTAGAQNAILQALRAQGIDGLAEAFGKTSAGQMAIFANKLDEIKETVGASLIPVLLRLMGVVVPLIEKFANASPQTQNFIIAMVAIIAAIGPVITIVGSLVTAIGAIAPVATAVGAFLAGPFILPFLAVIAVLGVLYLAFKNNWFGITDIVMKATSKIDAFVDRTRARLDGLNQLLSRFVIPKSISSLGANSINALGLYNTPVRDNGGPGVAGQTYMIGKGAQPELFTPKTDGWFTPNAGGMGAGGGAVNITINATVSNESQIDYLAQQVAKRISKV